MNILDEEKKEKLHLRLWNTVVRFLKWAILGVVTGIIVGLFATVFAKLLGAATSFREAHPYTFLTLPIGGVMIVGLYKLLKMENDKGTDNVIDSIESDIIIPLRLAFLISASTVITIFCGGSVGREGAALQIGASLGNGMSGAMKFKPESKKIMIMSGMAAAFGALFQTPVAAAFFAMEVSSVGIMHYAALIPCILSSLTAYSIIRYFGVPGEHFPVGESLNLSIGLGTRVLILAALCAVLSIVFCICIQTAEKLLHQSTKNRFLRIIIGSGILILLNLLVGTSDYQGTGMAVIEKALEGDANTFAFFFKLLFTVVTIAAGFKGGEIVPSFFIGATFGCVIAPVLGIPVMFGASVGMIAVFCGVTNCPVASLLLSIELFGTGNMYFFLLAIATSYMLSGYFSLYHTQVIVFSKNEEKHINHRIGHIFKH